MPLSPQHKAATRERIVQAAGKIFRQHGYEAASIDAIMAEAGLTRGGFYAHFKSKQQLFATVLALDHGLIRMLVRRQATDSAHWRAQTLKLLRDYLEPDHMSEISRDCSFAALTAEAGRGEQPVREGYSFAFETLATELQRRYGQTAEQAAATASASRRRLALELAARMIGAMVLAKALGSGAAAAANLLAARRDAEGLFAQLHSPRRR